MFLNERLDLDPRFGSSIEERSQVQIVTTGSGKEYRRQVHPYLLLAVNFDFMNKTETELMDKLVGLYRRAGGRFGVFRLKNPLEYTTNNNLSAPTYSDASIFSPVPGTNNWQMQKPYQDANGGSGRRKISLPISGTLGVGIGWYSEELDLDGVQQVTLGFTVNYNSGLISFVRDVTGVITSISQAAQAVIGITGHGYFNNDVIGIKDVVGMDEINGYRARIVSTTTDSVTVDLDTTSFGAYSSGGSAFTLPDSSIGEFVTFGCEFDIPVRFETDLSGLSFVSRNPSDLILGANVRLIEVLNPDDNFI